MRRKLRRRDGRPIAIGSGLAGALDALALLARRCPPVRCCGGSYGHLGRSADQPTALNGSTRVAYAARTAAEPSVRRIRAVRDLAALPQWDVSAIRKTELKPHVWTNGTQGGAD